MINASEALHEQSVIVLSDVGDLESSNAVSWDGLVAEILTFLTDRSGTSGKVILRKNPAAIVLLDRWINQYGDTRAPDLDEQLAELHQHRFVLRST